MPTQQNPAALPSPPAAPAAPAAAARVYPGGPTAVWRAAQAQRRELRSQLETLQDTRRRLSEQLRNPMVEGADRKGLEQRLANTDAQIAATDKQIAAANTDVAKAAAVPGAVVEDPPFVRSGPPEEVYFLTGIFMIVVFLPLSIAMARRIWRRGAAAIAVLPHELMERLTRLDQAVDSIAVEVERIGEGQRFVTRLFGDREKVERLP
jgi:hypothetical protein